MSDTHQQFNNGQAKSDLEIAAARALNPILDAFHRVNGLLLRRVCKTYQLESLKRLVLNFDQLSLIFIAEAEFDSVKFFVESADAHNTDEGEDSTISSLWGKFIGLPFGWGWITMNQQGYCDGVLLSFDGIVPQIFLHVVASSIKESAVERLTLP